MEQPREPSFRPLYVGMLDSQQALRPVNGGEVSKFILMLTGREELTVGEALTDIYVPKHSHTQESGGRGCPPDKIETKTAGRLHCL